MARAETSIVSAQVPAGVRQELERLAVEGDRSLSAEVRRALNEHLRSDAAPVFVVGEASG